MNTISLALLAAILAVPASAQTEAVALQARAFEATAADLVARVTPVDVFADVPECGNLDMKTIRGWSLDEAADLAEPCLKAVGLKRGESLSVQAGFLAAATASSPAVPGLLLKADLAPGCAEHRALAYSLARRNGELLGHRVRLLVRGDVEPASVSAVQAALGRCILPDVVRDVKDSGDFVKIYGKCLLSDADLKIDEIRPAQGMTVTLKTEQSPVAVEALNGFVTVNAGKGPVRFMVVAYAAQVARP